MRGHSLDPRFKQPMKMNKAGAVHSANSRVSHTLMYVFYSFLLSDVFVAVRLDGPTGRYFIVAGQIITVVALIGGYSFLPSFFILFLLGLSVFCELRDFAP